MNIQNLQTNLKFELIRNIKDNVEWMDEIDDIEEAVRMIGGAFAIGVRLKARVDGLPPSSMHDNDVYQKPEP